LHRDLCHRSWYDTTALLDLSKGFSLPAWAVKPSQLKDSYLDVQKDNITAQVIPIGKSPAKIFGRVKELCDQLLEHGSISRQHAAIVHCAQGPTIIDLKSSHGTKLNESKIPPAQPMLLKGISMCRSAFIAIINDPICPHRFISRVYRNGWCPKVEFIELVL